MKMIHGEDINYDHTRESIYATSTNSFQAGDDQLQLRKLHKQGQAPQHAAKATYHRKGHNTRSIQKVWKGTRYEAGEPLLDETSRGVHIFSHFGMPKPPVIKGDIHPAVIRLGLQFSEFKITGVNARCITVLSASKIVIQDYMTPRNNTLSRDASLASDYTSRVSNANVNFGIDLPEQDTKDALCDAIDTYIRDHILLADRVTHETAEKKIKDSDVILTYARSV